MTEFQDAILKVVRLVPEGKVVSYGQVAAYIGAPRAARQVGWTMRSLEGTSDFPWWRVLNNAGRITIKGNQANTPLLQKELLEGEGIKIVEGEGYELAIEEYRFRPSTKLLKSLQLESAYIDTVLRKYDIA